MATIVDVVRNGKPITVETFARLVLVAAGVGVTMRARDLPLGTLRIAGIGIKFAAAVLERAPAWHAPSSGEGPPRRAVTPPRTRAECPPAPCPWSACRHHLPGGRCALAFADEHPDGATAEAVGALLGVSRQRIYQIERIALRKLSLSLASDEP